jgi:hypothetical protein
MVGVLSGLIVGQMACNTRMREPRVDAVAMAGGACGSQMCPGERELRMVQAGAGPGDRLVAPMAVPRPTLDHVIGALRAGQIPLMACLAADGSAGEISDLSSRMTPETGNPRVRADERKARAVVQNNLTFGKPVGFVVTLVATRAELAPVYVFMATRTTAFRKHRDRAAVIVATQALCALVGASQRDSGFLRVVKLEIRADVGPFTTFMAE